MRLSDAQLSFVADFYERVLTPLESANVFVLSQRSQVHFVFVCDKLVACHKIDFNVADCDTLPPLLFPLDLLLLLQGHLLVFKIEPGIGVGAQSAHSLLVCDLVAQHQLQFRVHRRIFIHFHEVVVEFLKGFLLVFVNFLLFVIARQIQRKREGHPGTQIRKARRNVAQMLIVHEAAL